MRQSNALKLVLLAALTVSATSILCHAAGQENFGNEEIHEANYGAWPQVMPVINNEHRVYHVWVNGAESFHFLGDTADLNAALKSYSRVTADKLVVVLHPGPGTAKSFDGESIEFNWKLDLLGGIAAGMSERLDKGDLVWDPAPYLHVYLDKRLKLDELEMPDRLDLITLQELQARYIEAFASTDQTVRGWTCGRLTRLNPYSKKSLLAVGAMLEDEVDWVKLNAASALNAFKASDPSVVEKLATLTTDDEKLAERIKKAQASLEAASKLGKERAEFEKQLERIDQFVAKFRKSR